MRRVTTSAHLSSSFREYFLGFGHDGGSVDVNDAGARDGWVGRKKRANVNVNGGEGEFKEVISRLNASNSIRLRLAS